MKTFCYCYSVRIGSLMIGSLGLIGSLCSYFYSCFELLKAKAHGESTNFEQGIFIALIVGASVSLLIHVLLIFGIKKNKKNFMLPWIILFFIGCCLITLALFMQFYSSFDLKDQVEEFIVETIILTVYCILSWYFWICVWSYYKEIRDVQGITRSGVYFTQIMDNVTNNNKNGALFV